MNHNHLSFRDHYLVPSAHVFAFLIDWCLRERFRWRKSTQTRKADLELVASDFPQRCLWQNSFLTLYVLHGLYFKPSVHQISKQIHQKLPIFTWKEAMLWYCKISLQNYSAIHSHLMKPQLTLRWVKTQAMNYKPYLFEKEPVFSDL